LSRRFQVDVLVAARGADVGQFLLLGRIDGQVVVARVFADDHAFVDFVARRDEQLGPLLQGVQRVGDGAAADHRHQHAVAASGDIALDRPVASKR
jgi:hypothetical protein